MRLGPFSKTYESVKVLDLPVMEFEKKKIYAVLGANGSGKSTFSKIASGIIRSDSNDVMPSGIAYLPQRSYGFRMKVKKNIMLGNKDEKKADYLMEKLSISHLSDKRADRLSGGETARMALARLMMNSYEMVILDEPTAAMDMETTAMAEKLIQEYVAETGCVMILVTHSLAQARRISDEILFFHKGKLCENGSSQKLVDSAQTEELKKFLEFYGN